MTRAAAIDTGSNTILLLVGEADGDQVRVLRDEIEFARLGEGVDRTKRLSDAAFERGLAAFRRYAGICREMGVEKIVASGTSALRDATNGPDFLAAVKKETGIALEIIGGEREANLGFAAATGDLPEGTPCVVLDIGGGSTELIFGGARQGPREAISFDIGAVRLTERWVKNDPPLPGEIERLVRDARETLASAPKADGPFEVYGVSGTCTTLAAVEQKMTEYDSRKIHGTSLSRSQIDALLAAFRATDSAGRAKMPGLHPKRADVVIAGTLILQEVLTRYGRDRLLISDRGIRHALLREALFP